MNKKEVWVVIPGFNEESRIGRVVELSRRHCDNILVIDDGSSDNTSKVSERAGASHVVRMPVNVGKGKVLRYGCDIAIKYGARILVIIDSDLQHEPSDIPRLLSALEGNDIVFTYRDFRGSMPFIFRFGNWFISKTAHLLFGIRLWDTQCGYRCFTGDAYKKIRWNSDRYSMDTEMIALAGKHKLKFTQIKIKTIYSDRRKGTNVLDGFKIVWNMIKWKMTK